jgi:TonB family protein
MIAIPLLLTKVTVLAAVASIAYLSGRKFSAAMRHALCVSAVILICLAPVCNVNPAAQHSIVFRLAAEGGFGTSATLRAPLSAVTMIWLIGLVVMAGRFALGLAYLGSRSWRARASEWKVSGVRVRLGDVSTPMVWGWVRPVILVPRDGSSWPPEQMDLALRHEMNHLRRGDNWIALLIAAARALYWFHPLVWWLTSKLMLEQEIICDERVLASGAPNATYAQLLVDVSRNLSSPALFGCAMFSDTHQLRGRIMRILAYPSGTAPSRGSRFLFTLALFTLVTAGVLIPAKGGNLAADKPGSVYQIGGDVSAPKLIHKEEPHYTKAATKKKIQGTVVLSVVIDTGGLPTNIRLERGLDSGLDEKAIEAVQQWRFSPAERDGKPVAVAAHIEVNFKLK